MSMTERPNLLYILSDQHNPAVTGCYGDPLVQTPHLDALAANGVILDHAYCTAPLCVPSRMSMLTGQHPYQNEVWTNEHILSSAIPTFAHALGAAGYHPVQIGRMHALGPDQHCGYVERLVGDLTTDYDGFAGRYPNKGMLGGAGSARASLELSGSGQSGYQFYDDHVTAATVDYLNRLGMRKRYGQSAEPFCLSVGFVLPHPPLAAWPKDYDLYRGRMTMPRHPASFSSDLHPFVRWWRQRSGMLDMSDEAVIRARTAYWALVTRMDIMIGQIIAALHANGLADNTLIVYMSDHGEQVGEHGLWWKHTFYEGSVRVPVILSWPGVIPDGQRCRRVASTLDVMATMLDALGAPALPRSHGRSLLNLVRHPDREVEWVDEAFAESCLNDGWYMRMVRRDTWKLNYYHGHEPQLFDLASDPCEQVDRARDPACASIRQELVERILQDWDPESIARTMATKRADTNMIESWMQSTQPPNQIRWDPDPRPTPEMYYLDEHLARRES